MIKRIFINIIDRKLFSYLENSFFNSKESKFKVNVLKLNKIDKIRNFDIYEI